MKKYTPEQIVTLLGQLELEIARGKSTPQVCRGADIAAQSCYRWRKWFGGLKLDQAKGLEPENGDRPLRFPLADCAISGISGFK